MSILDDKWLLLRPLLKAHIPEQNILHKLTGGLWGCALREEQPVSYCSNGEPVCCQWQLVTDGITLFNMS